MKESKIDCILRLTVDGQLREHFGLAHVVETEYDARFQVGYGHVTMPAGGGDWRRITDDLINCSEARLNLDDGRTAKIKAVRSRYEWSVDAPSYFGFYFVALGPFALVVRGSQSEQP